MGYPRFFSQNLLTDPAMLAVSSARLGERGRGGGGGAGLPGPATPRANTAGIWRSSSSWWSRHGGRPGRATFRWKGGATAIWEANKVATSVCLISLRTDLPCAFVGSGFMAGRSLLNSRPAGPMAGPRCWTWIRPGSGGPPGALLRISTADLGVPTQVAAMIRPGTTSPAGPCTLEGTDTPNLDDPAAPSDYDETNGRWPLPG